MKLSEAANRVIDLARKVHDYYETELRKRYPHYPLVDLDEENVPPPPEEKELEDFLATLPDDMIYQLILIMHFSRGEFRADEMAAYYQEVKGMFSDAGDAASQMMFDKATLADVLADGLEELRRYKINVDKMPLQKVKVRKR
jgi:hypothetical protein